MPLCCLGSSRAKVDSRDNERGETAAMAKQMKLHYFDFAGRGEFIRLLLAAAKRPFEDYRFKKEDWPTLKSNYPLKTVPVLEVEHKMLPQSLAIGRFIARETGLIAKDSFLQAVGDAVVDTMQEAVDFFITILFLEGAAKEEALKKFLEEKLPALNDDMGRLLELSGSKDSGFVCGKELTWADVYVFFAVDGFAKVEPQVDTKYPSLGRIKKQVETSLAIAEYLKTRPK